MSTCENFIFGIPLIARASARDWQAVEALLSLTLASLGAQTDGRFRIVIAGHDRPDLPLHGVDFLQADWPAEAVRADNLDAGRKKHAIQDRVLAEGGGLLMFVDADDWVDVRTVETARAGIGPEQVGGLITKGFAVNLLDLRAAPLPHPTVFDGGFHKLCGSSTIARLDPDDPDPARRDPHRVLHEHYRWEETARERGWSIAHLPLGGCYVVNTSVNHSEAQGPFADWRRSFNRDVAREGAPVGQSFAAGFGLSHPQIVDARDRIVSAAQAAPSGVG